jgi:hypothetical protein
MRRFAQLSSVLIVALIMSGCGDVYRPVVIPNPPPTPDPKAAHNLYVISDNGPANKGTTMQVNVSGDTNMGAIPVGIAPVHASLTGSGGRVLSANSLGDSVSVIAPASTFGGIAKVADVVLPTGFHPSFVTTAETTAFYVAGNGATPSLGFVNGSNAVVDIKPVPGSAGTILSMAETSDAKKIYVASSSANSVTPVNVIDHSSNTAIPVSTPVWVSARSDAGRVYVLSQGAGDLIEINPLDDSLVPNTVVAGAGANYMFYDSHLNRLYITNPVASTTTVVNVAPASALLLRTVPIAAAVRDAADVCAGISPGAVKVVSATALLDGTRAYIGGYTTLTSGVSISTASGDGTLVSYTYAAGSGPSIAPGMGITITGFSPDTFNGNYTIATVGAGTFQVFSPTPGSNDSGTVGAGAAQSICPQVTVLNSSDNSVRSVIPLDRAPAAFGCDVRFRLSMAASADSTKVYVGSCDAAGVTVIHADVDQVSLKLSAPPSAAPSLAGQAPPPQNPVFVVAGP